jgi:hypothetical protein
LPLTAADERYDFQSIPGLKTMLAVLLARYQLPVHLDRHELWIELQLRQQIDQRQSIGDVARLAINRDYHVVRSLDLPVLALLVDFQQRRAA